MMYAYPYKDDGNLGRTNLSAIIQLYIKPEWFDSQLRNCGHIDECPIETYYEKQ